MARNAKPWFLKQTQWWMAYIGGQKTKLAKGRENLKAAKSKLRELLTAAEANPASTDEQTVASVIEAYGVYASKRLAASTMAMRKPYLQSFAEALGKKLVRDCGPEHMESWVESHPEWVSDWTRNGAIRNVQVAFNWAASRKVDRSRRLIPENPFRGVTHPVGEPRRDMTDAEFVALLRSTVERWWKTRPTPGKRFREILIFLRYTGARPSEAAKLRWSHIDTEQGVIVLTEHKTSRTQKVKKPRIIALHPSAIRLLARIRRRGEGEYVFVNHRRTPWNKNSLALRIKRAREKAGLPDDVKLYGVRHAFGTRAITNGSVDLKTLSELMGHTTTRTTEHYLHVAGKHEHLARAMLSVNGPRPGK